MASIYKEILIDANAEDVWAAVRDVGAVHRRLAPGFVVEVRLEGDSRIVTFANGSVIRELIVDIDDMRHRLVYAVVEWRPNTTTPRCRSSRKARAAPGSSGSPTCCRTIWRDPSVPSSSKGQAS